MALTQVTKSGITADAVDATKIADNAVDSEHYTDGSIDNAHIADDAIDSEHYATGSIDTAHIADDAVDADKLANAINTSIAAKLPLAGGTMSGNIAGGDTTVSAVNLKDVGVTTNAIGSIGGGTQDIDLTAGNSVSGTVDTSTTTFTFSNPTASDDLCTFSLILTNGGSQTVNFPATVDWAGGTAPTLTTAGVDILVFATIDGGTIWHGFAAALDSKTPS